MNLHKDELIRINQKHLWHPFTQMKQWMTEDPLFIERGEGNYLIDIEGKRYLDGVSSLWTNVHGHNKQEINDAITKQIGKISHSTMLGLANVPATELAKRLAEISPGKLNKIFYSDSGATAVEIGLKMAYQYWRQREKPVPSKTRFITLSGAYHGDTIGSVSLGGIDLFHKIFSHLLFETYSFPCPNFHGSDFSTPEECMNNSLKVFESVLRQHHSEIIGLFIEPYVQGAAGMIVYPKGFMKSLYSVCRKYEILFIVDEVATGFGRTGRMFACEEDDLEPDIMSVAKGLSGGYLPLAATITTDEIFDAFLGEYDEFKAFYHGHTFTGNPLACAAALASLDLFNKEMTIKNLGQKIELLDELLAPVKELTHVGDVRQKGFMVGIELAEVKSDRKRYAVKERMGHKVCMEARKHGVIIRPLGDVVILMPPLSITPEELRLLTNVVRDSIIEVCG